MTVQKWMIADDVSKLVIYYKDVINLLTSEKRDKRCLHLKLLNIATR